MEGFAGLIIAGIIVFILLIVIISNMGNRLACKNSVY